MKVVAKWQIAYQNNAYIFGDEFEMSESDYEQYKNDVEVVKVAEKKVKKMSNKKVSKSKNKSVKK